MTLEGTYCTTTFNAQPEPLPDVSRLRANHGGICQNASAMQMNLNTWLGAKVSKDQGDCGISPLAGLFESALMGKWQIPS